MSNEFDKDLQHNGTLSHENLTLALTGESRVSLGMNFTAQVPSLQTISLDNNPGSKSLGGQHYFISRMGGLLYGIPRADFAISTYDGSSFAPLFVSSYQIKQVGIGVTAGWSVRTFNNVLDDSTGNMTVLGTLTLNSPNAPLKLNNLKTLPSNVGPEGTLCLVNGLLYSSDGAKWVSTSPIIATSNTVNGVTVVNNAVITTNNTLDDSVGNIKIAGRIEEVGGVTTEGNFGVSTITSNATSVQLTTTDTAIATFTPANPGNFVIYLYYRILNNPATVTIKVSWNDGFGTINETLVGATQVPSYYSVVPFYFYSTAASPITVTASSSAASQVYLSTTIEGK